MILMYKQMFVDLLIKNNPIYYSDVCETLAWASAQIHCQCSVSDDKVIFSSNSPVAQEELAISNKHTSFAPCVGMILILMSTVYIMLSPTFSFHLLKWCIDPN